MLTKFKIFEIYKEPNNWYTENEPKLHDYVILDCNWHNNIHQFLSNNIGQISKIKKNNKDSKYIQYQIMYEKPPEKYKKQYFQHNRFGWVYRAQIKHFSSNIKDLELILDINKYNL